MAKCKKCGAFASKDDIFCPVCKTKLEEDFKDKSRETLKRLSKTSDFSGSYSQQDKVQNKIQALLCYLPFICLYPILVTSRKSPFVKFHAGQGLTLFIAELVVSTIFWVLSTFVLTIPIVGTILSLPVGILGYAIELATFAATIYGIYQTLTGKASEIPVIGKFRFFK